MRIDADWTNSPFLYTELNDGEKDSMPFNDILVMDAYYPNGTTAKCPTFEEHLNETGDTHTS